MVLTDALKLIGFEASAALSLAMGIQTDSRNRRTIYSVLSEPASNIFARFRKKNNSNDSAPVVEYNRGELPSQLHM